MLAGREELLEQARQKREAAVAAAELQFKQAAEVLKAEKEKIDALQSQVQQYQKEAEAAVDRLGRAQEKAPKEETLKEEALKKEAPDEKAKLIKEKEEVKLNLLDAVMFGKLDAALSEITKAEVPPQPARSKEDAIRSTLLASCQDGSLDAALAQMTPAPRAISSPPVAPTAAALPVSGSDASRAVSAGIHRAVEMKERITNSMRIIDNDNNGRIGQKELRQLLAKFDSSTNWQDLDLASTNWQVDVDKDGKIKLDELMTWMYADIVGHTSMLDSAEEDAVRISGG